MTLFLDKMADGLKPWCHQNVSSILVLLHKFVSVHGPSVLVLGIDQASCSSPMMKQVNNIDSKDITTSGSCNRHLVLTFAMLYHMIGWDGFKKMVKHSLSNVEYLTK